MIKRILSVILIFVLSFALTSCEGSIVSNAIKRSKEKEENSSATSTIEPSTSTTSSQVPGNSKYVSEYERYFDKGANEMKEEADARALVFEDQVKAMDWAGASEDYWAKCFLYNDIKDLLVTAHVNAEKIDEIADTYNDQDTADYYVEELENLFLHQSEKIEKEYERITGSTPPPIPSDIRILDPFVDAFQAVIDELPDNVTMWDIDQTANVSVGLTERDPDYTPKTSVDVSVPTPSESSKYPGLSEENADAVSLFIDSWNTMIQSGIDNLNAPNGSDFFISDKAKVKSVTDFKENRPSGTQGIIITCIDANGETTGVIIEIDLYEGTFVGIDIAGSNIGTFSSQIEDDWIMVATVLIGVTNISANKNSDDLIDDVITLMATGALSLNHWTYNYSTVQVNKDMSLTSLTAEQ